MQASSVLFIFSLACWFIVLAGLYLMWVSP